MAGVDEWKKFFEREEPGFSIFDTIHCAIAVASLLMPEEFKRHRDEIVAEIMAATQQTSKNNNKVNNNTTVHHEASKNKLNKPSSISTLTKVDEDDKIIKTSTSTATGVSAVSLDEESLDQQKLETSKRKLQQGYQKVAAAKKQRSLEVLELNELPKKVPGGAIHPKKVLGRSSHLHGQNNRKLCAI